MDFYFFIYRAGDKKLEIAHKLDELGVSRIEAGFPRVSAEDAEAIQLMQKAGIKAELWGLSRAVKADVEELVRLNLRYSVIEAPTSAIKLKAYGISREEVLRRIRDAVSAARGIVLGKKSGLDNIDLKCKELGVTITTEQRGPVLAAVKQAAVKQAAAGKCGLVNNDQFRQILAAMHIV